jgi:hypothetical protein
MDDTSVPTIIPKVSTSLHQSIWRPVGIMKDIPVRIRNSVMLLEMDVFLQIQLILGRPLLSTTRAMIDVAARIIKLNISRKEETSTFKPNGTEKCNQVMVMYATLTVTRSPVALPNYSSNLWRQSCSWTINVKALAER